MCLHCKKGIYLINKKKKLTVFHKPLDTVLQTIIMSIF